MRERKRRRIPKNEVTDEIRKRAKRRRITWRLDVVNIFGDKVGVKYVSTNGSFTFFNYNEEAMKKVDLQPTIEGVRRVALSGIEQEEREEEERKEREFIRNVFNLDEKKSDGDDG
jgi:hypothetical protein